MKQVLLRSASAGYVSAQRKQSKQGIRFAKSFIVISLNGRFSSSFFFEVDEGFDSGHHYSADPDNMTDDAFWR